MFNFKRSSFLVALYAVIVPVALLGIFVLLLLQTTRPAPTFAGGPTATSVVTSTARPLDTATATSTTRPTDTATATPTATSTARPTDNPTATPTATSTVVSASGPIPISHWPADNSALDTVDGNHGTLAPGTTYDAGYSGQAFKFEAINSDYVRIPFSANLNPTTWTMAAWIKPLGPVPGQTWIFGQNFSKQLNAVPGSDTKHLRIQWQINASGFEWVTSDTQLEVDRWAHVAGTWDGQYLRLYIDGVLDGKPYQVIPTPSVNSCPFFIGGVIETATPECTYTGQFFDGLVDEVKFFGLALAADDVRQLANAATPTTRPTNTPTATSQGGATSQGVSGPPFPYRGFPTSVPTPVTAPYSGEKEGLGVRLTSVSLKGASGNTLQVQPGEKFDVSLAFDVWSTLEPIPGGDNTGRCAATCIVNATIGMVSSDGTYLPLFCIYSGAPGNPPGVKATWGNAITSPAVPGVYGLRLDYHLTYNCQQALRDIDPARPAISVATIEVK